MVMSMTGFGRGEASDDARTVAAEIRSVNHRYSEINVKLPRKFSFVEDAVKKTVRAQISRGKTDISFSILSGAESDTAVTVNKAIANQYFIALNELKNDFDVTGDISLAMLAGMPDVLSETADTVDEDALTAIFTSATEAALKNFNAMRADEGTRLVNDLRIRASNIENSLTTIAENAPNVPMLYAKKLRTRIEEILKKESSITLTEERIAIETAFFADKANITEEIVRLKSHIVQFRSILSVDGKPDKPEPIGKKLDFLAQEMNREANTIGSKANDLSITEGVIDLKSEIEKIREQVQNLE